jgi:serine/threonine-protein kinase
VADRSDPLTGLPTEGELIGNRYRLGELLGVGGMGAVRAAKHTTLGHDLAIKLMLPELARKPGAAARFLREARASVSIGSEHVARVIDVDELPDGTPYIVMERLRGQDLHTLLERRGPLPVEEAVGFVLQAAEAVAEAHSLGIVHRDLKPRNLFVAVRPDGELSIKVLDFGIAKATDPVAAITQTHGNVALGSPHYMSPEQVRDPANVDARTDVWSLGVVLFQLTTGDVPFDEDTLPALGAAIVGDPHPKLSDKRPDAPSGFSELVDRCLSKKASDRFADLSELAKALEPFASAQAKKSVTRCVRVIERRARENEATQPVSMGAETMEMSAPVKRGREPETQAGLTASTDTDLGPALASGPRSRALWIGLGLAGVAAGAYFAFGRGNGEPPAPVATQTQAAPPAIATPAPKPSAAREPEPVVEVADAGEPVKPRPQPKTTRPPVPKPGPSARDPYGDRK